MSLRPEIVGFKLAQLQSLCGSGDRAAIRNLKSRFAHVTPDSFDDDDEYHDLFHQALERAIMKGVPFDDLQSETNSHIQLAILLGEYKQKFISTSSNSLKMRGFWEFQRKYPNALSSEANDLFGIFTEGRPLFGRKIQTDWSYYGYLSRDEVAFLEESLIEVKDIDDAFQEFVNSVITIFSMILKRKCDLWFWTA
jgi:hypothetical protein